jgi:tetraacyldisaccharide 4'-kinase
MVGADRIKNGRAAIRDWGADILVLDDGFQCWNLSRDIDILAIDATNPFGNGNLLPRGILREPVGHLARANIYVLTKTDAAAQKDIDAVTARIRSLNPQAFIVSSVHQPSRITAFGGEDLSVDWIKGKEFVAVCGIADPAYFIKTLEVAGAIIKQKIVFQDHHPYCFQDIVEIIDICQQVSVKRVITTQKDMIKLQPLMEKHAASFEKCGLEFFTLGIRLQITKDFERFMERLLSR